MMNKDEIKQFLKDNKVKNVNISDKELIQVLVKLREKTITDIDILDYLYSRHDKRINEVSYINTLINYRNKLYKINNYLNEYNIEINSKKKIARNILVKKR